MPFAGLDLHKKMVEAVIVGDDGRLLRNDRFPANQSGEHCYHGCITKQGRSHARWLLVQAAQHLDRHPGPPGVFFRRIARKKNRNVAVVATARKLVAIAWHMLKHHEPYRYAQPHTVHAKFARLRVRATAMRNVLAETGFNRTLESQGLSLSGLIITSSPSSTMTLTSESSRT